MPTRPTEKTLCAGVWLAVALALIAGLLVSQMPATWLDWGIHKLSDKRLTLANAHGTVWRGDGELRLLMPDGTWLTPVRPRWVWQPQSLLQGALHWRFFADTQPASPVLTDLRLTLHGLDLRNFALDMPAATLGTLSDTLRNTQLGGQIQLRAAQIQVNSEGIHGQLHAGWHNAQSGWVPGLVLGTYQLKMAGEGRLVSFNISTLNGVLSLDGQGHWQTRRLPQLSVIAKTTPEHRDRLMPILRTLGRRIDEDRYQIGLDAHAGVAGAM